MAQHSDHRKIVRLDGIRRGMQVEICDVSGLDSDVQRLNELGIRPGNRIEVLQHGCPCIVRLRGAKFCIRGEDCHCVLVAIDQPHS